MDLQQIKTLIHALEETLRCNVCVHDYSDRIRPVLGSEYSIHTSPFCSAIKRPGDYKGPRCMADDMEKVQSRLEKTRSPFFKVCHMNVCEAVCPIMQRGQVLGALFFGPFIPDEDFPEESLKRTVRLSRYTAGDRTAYSRLQVFTVDEAGNLMALAEAVTLQISVFVSEDSLKPKETLTRIELIDRFIHYRMGGNIGLDDLAVYLNVSGSRMTQLLRDLKGKSFPAVLNEARIERAKRYLSHSRFSIGQVAENCGFRDQAYFHRVFKKAVGITPGQYRRKHYKERQV